MSVEKSFSQWGQDTFIDKIVFAGKRRGVFVDVGAHDGITFSNSYFFETRRDWRGVCVEPLPSRYQELVTNRRCACVNKAVSQSESVATFTIVEGSDMLSGLTESLSEAHLARIASTTAATGTENKLITVSCDTLDAIVSTEGVAAIDLLSIDVEGLEIQVLETLDFGKHPVACITVEDNAKPGEMEKFLTPRGFRFLTRIGGDCVFVHAAMGPMPARRYRMHRFLNALGQPHRWLAYGRRLISALGTQPQDGRR